MKSDIDNLMCDIRISEKGKIFTIKEILEIIKRFENGENLTVLASIYQVKFKRILYWVKHKEKLIFLFENDLDIKDYEQTLSIQQKLEIINLSENSGNISAIADKYFLYPSMIKCWIKNKKRFEKSVNEEKIKLIVETSDFENNENIKTTKTTTTITKINEKINDCDKTQVNQELIGNNENVKENYKSSRKYFTIEEKLKVIIIYESGGMSINMISERYNIAPSTIKNWLRIKEKLKQQQTQNKTTNLIKVESEVKC